MLFSSQKIAIFGDSLSDVQVRSPELAPYTKNDRISQDGRLWVDYVRGSSASRNFAIAGQGTADLRDQITRFAATQNRRAKTAVLAIGTNDRWQSTTTVEALDNVRNAIAQLREIGVRKFVVLGLNNGLNPMSNPGFDIRAYNDGLSKLAGTAYADPNRAIAGLPNSGTWDGTHYTPEANRAIGRLVGKILRRLRWRRST